MSHKNILLATLVSVVIQCNQCMAQAAQHHALGLGGHGGCLTLEVGQHLIGRGALDALLRGVQLVDAFVFVFQQLVFGGGFGFGLAHGGTQLFDTHAVNGIYPALLL